MEVATLRLTLPWGEGTVAVSARRAGFPTDRETHLLRVAVGQDEPEHLHELALPVAFDTGDAEKVARGLIEDDRTKLAWNLPRVLMAKNRVKLLLNMMLLAAQAIPRGGQIVVDPVGEGDTIGFKLSVTGTNAKIPQAIPNGRPGTGS